MDEIERMINRQIQISEMQGAIKVYKQIIKDLNARISATEHNIENLLNNSIECEEGK